MEQKRVSYKIAKALKEAGYPQGITRDVYVIKEDCRTCIEYPIGVCISSSVALPQDYIADIPFALDVWLWLWRQKKYRILFSASNQRWNEVHGIVTGTDGEVCESYHRGAKAYDATDHDANWSDPEEAIEKAVEYLVDNKLLK